MVTGQGCCEALRAAGEILLLVPGRHHIIGEIIGMYQNGMSRERPAPRVWRRRSANGMNLWRCGVVDQQRTKQALPASMRATKPKPTQLSSRILVVFLAIQFQLSRRTTNDILVVVPAPC